METKRDLGSGAATLALFVALTGCSGGGSPTLAVNLTGTYVGAFVDPSVRSYPLTLTLTQTGTSLLGPWSGGLVNPPNEFPYANGGDIEGSINGSAVSLGLLPVPYNELGYSLTGQVSGTSIVGTFTVGGSPGGTFSLKKQ